MQWAGHLMASLASGLSTQGKHEQCS